MTRDEIIRMAEEAGWLMEVEWDETDGFMDLLERFAIVVAKHEREACANICLAQLWVDHNGYPLKGGAEGDCNIELLCCIDKIRERSKP